jgi:VCBS repeat protein
MNRIGLLFAILIIGIHGASAQVRQFNLPTEYAAGFDPFAPVGPKQMAVGDFNHDGNRDIAFIHGVGFGSVVTVMLGNGDGTFRPAMDFQTAFGPQSIAVADFNGDGNEDLAVSCAGVLIDSSDSSISILLSNGDGTFATHVDYAPGGQPSPIATGDFNGDGTMDIAFSYNGAVSVLLNNGDGTFRPPLDSPGGGAVRAVGDLNGDGKADLVVHTNYMLGVMLGNGDGTFQAPVTYSVPADPFSVAITDLNGDGRLDVAAYCIHAAQENTFISVLLGNGDGTLRNHVDYAVGLGEFYGNVAAADINGDGHPDLSAFCWAMATVRFRRPSPMLRQASSPWSLLTSTETISRTLLSAAIRLMCFSIAVAAF